MVRDTLEYLEQVRQHNDKWNFYCAMRALEVRKAIVSMRTYAGARPGRVADFAENVANEWERRLDAVLAGQG